MKHNVYAKRVNTAIYHVLIFSSSRYDLAMKLNKKIYDI